jgi:para-nitrobenzyl esterase
VVSVNYRVGALGFAHLADIGGAEWAGSTNVGHQDQAAGLGWVRSHIAAFGGDPTNVTLAGHSAGGFSIGALLAMPAADGLFDKAVLSSGSTGRVYDRELASELATDFLQQLRVGEVADLIDVPGDAIIAAQRAVAESDIGKRNTPGGQAWGTVLDGEVLTSHPLEAVARGGANGIPMIVGATRDEVQLFEASNPGDFAPQSEKQLLDEMSRCIGPVSAKMLQGVPGRFS